MQGLGGQWGQEGEGRPCGLKTEQMGRQTCVGSTLERRRLTALSMASVGEGMGTEQQASILGAGERFSGRGAAPRLPFFWLKGNASLLSRQTGPVHSTEHVL